MAEKESKEVEFDVPEYIEREQFRKSINRKFALLTIPAYLIALASILLAALAFVRPLPAVIYDDGRPVYMSETKTARESMSDIRIKYFVDRYVRLYAGFDSIDVEKNYSEALNMMCAQARYLAMHNESETQRRKTMKEQNLYSVFEELNIKIGEYDPLNTDETITVLVTGHYKIDLRVGTPIGDEELKPKRWFVHVLLLKRIPVINQETVFGLCVHEFIPKYLKSENEYKKYLIDFSTKNRGAR